MLPLWLSRERCRIYEPVTLCVDRDAAAELLEEELTNRLENLVGEDGRVLQTKFQTRISDGLICVTAEAECLEEIGREVPAY